MDNDSFRCMHVAFCHPELQFVLDFALWNHPSLQFLSHNTILIQYGKVGHNNMFHYQVGDSVVSLQLLATTVITRSNEL